MKKLKEKKRKPIQQTIKDLVSKINNGSRPNLGIGTTGIKKPKNGINDGSQYRCGGMKKQ